MPETALKIDAGTLAWAADRLSLSDLTERERKIVDEIARYLEETLPLDDFGELELGEDVEPLKDEIVGLTAENLELEEAVTLVEANMDVQLIDAEQKIDVARVVAERLRLERAEGEKDATIPSRASTAERKAMRLLLERRVAIVRRETGGPFAGMIHAKVRGDSSTYDCGFDPRGRGTWRCTCQEMRGECSHLTAVKMVVAP